MLRFLLIFFAIATALLGILVFQSGNIRTSFFSKPRQAVSPEQNGAFKPNERVGLTVTPSPIRAMKALHFQVDLQDQGQPRSVMVDLSMPDMYMGMNQVSMKRSEPGVYKGVGIIPICPTGLTLWQASVIIDNQVAGDFFFDVQY
jgi:cytochrome c-type biogenesis protein CcmE